MHFAIVAELLDTFRAYFGELQYNFAPFFMRVNVCMHVWHVYVASLFYFCYKQVQEYK